MSTPQSRCIPVLVILFVIAGTATGAFAQNDSSSPGLQPAAHFTFTNPLPPRFLGSPAPVPAHVQIALAAPPPPPAAPPPQVSQATRQIKRKVRRWHIGGSVGAGFNPELFMLDVQSQIGPVFNKRFLLQPNAVFGFGELTDMFAVNLEGAYRLRTEFHGKWTPYIGMGPSLNFIHQGTSTKDVSFSNFSYKTGFNVFIGAQKNRTFVEMKTSLWSGKAPVLRLFIGYNF